MLTKRLKPVSVRCDEPSFLPGQLRPTLSLTESVAVTNITRSIAPHTFTWSQLFESVATSTNAPVQNFNEVSIL